MAWKTTSVTLVVSCLFDNSIAFCRLVSILYCCFFSSPSSASRSRIECDSFSLRLQVAIKIEDYINCCFLNNLCCTFLFSFHTHFNVQQKNTSNRREIERKDTSKGIEIFQCDPWPYVVIDNYCYCCIFLSFHRLFFTRTRHAYRHIVLN